MTPSRTLVCSLALAALGCGTDIAQTAGVAPDGGGGLSCTEPEQPVELPTEPEFGGGAMIDEWELATGDYGVDQGPGIAIAARDGFRLFANGHLLAESTASLESVFVPLTLLPGETVIAVVVTAESGPPGLLVELEELERAYPSNESWTASAAPSGDWMLPGFDDTSWVAATGHGSITENPDCTPSAGFPAGSTAHWITGPEPATSVAFRLTVRIEPTGYGADTTGGAGTEPVVADDLAELTALLEQPEPAVVLVREGVFDVRRTGADVGESTACPTDCPDGSGQITYNVLIPDTTCDRATVQMSRNERRLRVASDKTLVGLGRGALLRGAWLDFGMSQNVILRNVALYDVNRNLIEAGDAISIAVGDRLWVDHVTFKAISDGFIDVSMSASAFTSSWLRYDGTNEYACQARHPRSNEMVDTVATFHHTAWLHVNGRAPLATHAGSTVHLYNNLFSDDVDYAVGAGCDAQVLLEASVFENVRIPTSKRTCTDMTPGLGSIAVGAPNAYGAGVGDHDSDGMIAPEPSDPVFEPPYDYTPDPTDDLRFRVNERAGAGSRWALPLELD